MSPAHSQYVAGKLAIRLLLEHEHIYTDWNIDQLADTLREILDSESER